MFTLRNTLWPSLLVIALLGASTAHAAKLYKWIDKGGKVHYSEKPPTSAELEAAPPSEPEVEPVDNTPVEIPEPTDLVAAQKTADFCQNLYNDLERYKSSEQITNSEGNTMVISPEMRDSKIIEINQQLDQSCR